MLMLVVLGAAPAVAQDQEPVTSIYSVVSSQTQFSTLKLLIDALDGSDDTQEVFNDLGDTTSELTVFAPNNTAIDNWITVNFGTVAEALANRAAITQLLTYHVVPSVVRSQELTKDQVVSTLLSGTTITVATITPTVTLTTASSQIVTVTTPNNEAGNSIIHIVDHVLDPNGDAWMFGGKTRLQTTAEVATGTGSHGILLQVVTALGDPYLGLVTGTDEKLMVVAPNDAAFTKFVENANTTLADLLAETNMTTLKNVINYHIFYNTDDTVQGANGMSPNPLLQSAMTKWMAGVKLEMLNMEHLTVKMTAEDEWMLTTALNQNVTASILATSSGFLMPVMEVLSPTPASVTQEESGSSLYHVSMLTVASALMAVFGMVVAA